MAAVGEPSGVARAAGDARAVRLSRPVRAAALLRRNSRLCRRLAAPSRLAATGTSRGSREKRTESTRIEPPPTESISATSAVMAVVLAVGLAALCSGETNAKGGER